MAPSEFSNAQRTVYLVTRYIAGSIDFAELQELDHWRKASEQNEALFQEMTSPDEQAKALKRMQSYDSKATLGKIKEKIASVSQAKESRVLTLKRLLIAATSLVLIGSIYLQYLNHKKINPLVAQNQQATFVPAGTNKAILTLGNGQIINLDDTKAGTIAKQNGTTIQKKTGGLIVYVPSPTITDTTTTYNLIETPRGGQYRLELPDGTKVWLNAASSLKYPSRFNGKQRIVTLTGEGYFEVVHNASQAFIVKTTSQLIKDIGTSFNVNAYIDEPHSITTLVEGSVQLAAGNKKVTLRPGQQGITSTDNIKVSEADIETVTAWKNGQLAFHHSDIQNVLRQIARWYNIEIKYQGKVPDITISGGVSRSADLSAILKMLRLSEVHFTQQGHTLLIKQ